MASLLQQHRTAAVVGLLVWIALNGTLVAQGFTQLLPVVLLLGFFGTAAVMAVQPAALGSDRAVGPVAPGAWQITANPLQTNGIVSQHWRCHK